MFQVHAVSSNQQGLHPRLNQVVERHLAHAYRRPPAEPTRLVFAGLQAPPAQSLLDAGCGTGESSLQLARAHRNHWVLGLDKSASRLERVQGPPPANLELIRADLIDFALLAATAGWHFEKLFLLYPNPWPKSEHLQRRWHGHAIFPLLLQLAPRLEVRSNWRIYLEEFALALELAGWHSEITDWHPVSPISAFERKYALAGQPLYRLLGHRG